jgi:hypothetical protein
MKRTRAQRRWRRKGYTHELIQLRSDVPGKPRLSYLIGSQESWRQQRKFGLLIGMPVRPVCQQFLHNGRKP